MKFGIKSKNVVSDKEEQSPCYIIELVITSHPKLWVEIFNKSKDSDNGDYLIDELRVLVRSITKSH